MKERNCDNLKAEILTALAPQATCGDDCLCEDYGLLEALSVDMLDPEETRLYAEHLEKCERCRKKCAEAFELGVYDDSPFIDRMNACQLNPALEKDENWKKIALVFNPKLRVASRVAPSCEKSWMRQRVLAVASRVAPSRERSWMRQGVLAVAVAVLIVGAGTQVPFIMNSDSPNSDLPANSDSFAYDFETFKGASENAQSYETLKELSKEKLNAVAGAGDLYDDGRRLFDEENNYDEAAKKFEELVQALDKAEGVDAQTLFDARWNLSAAKANAGDPKGALDVLNSLKGARDKNGAELDAAIKALTQAVEEKKNENE